MSSKTKIVVLHMKEVIYTIIFVVLAILLAVLLFMMFGKDRKSTERSRVAPPPLQPLSTTLACIKAPSH